MAIELAKHGVKLCLSARRKDELERVRIECISAGNSLLANDDILVMPMDMLELDTHHRRLDQIVAHFGRIDVLVNNAGRSQRAAWQDVELAVDRELFDLDVFAVVHLTRCYVRYVLANTAKLEHHGHLVVTSSGAGLVGVPMSCSYVGAKHALHVRFIKKKKLGNNKINVYLNLHRDIMKHCDRNNRIWV